MSAAAIQNNAGSLITARNKIEQGVPPSTIYMATHDNRAQGMSMDAAMTATAAVRPAAASNAAVAKPEAHGMTFHELLASLNPLQHIPVVGTIYRAVTGDEIPEAARNIGSLAIGGIMGGPIGLAGNLVFLALRKLTGIDIDRIGQNLLADVGIGHHTSTDGDGVAVLTAQTATPVEPTQQDAGTRTTAWSAAQLKAYGVITDADGTLRQGDALGSDVLNGLLLAELRPANSTRSRNAGVAMVAA